MVASGSQSILAVSHDNVQLPVVAPQCPSGSPNNGAGLKSSRKGTVKLAQKLMRQVDAAAEEGVADSLEARKDASSSRHDYPFSDFSRDLYFTNMLRYTAAKTSGRYTSCGVLVVAWQGTPCSPQEPTA